MEVTFASNDLLECFQKERAATKKWGAKVGRKYISRITTINTMRSFEELYQFRSWHVHQLEGDRKGEYSIWLTERWRLIVTKGNTESSVEVKEVSNHYE